MRSLNEGTSDSGLTRQASGDKTHDVPAVDPLAGDEPPRDDEARNDSDQTQRHVNQGERRDAEDHGASLAEATLIYAAPVLTATHAVLSTLPLARASTSHGGSTQRRLSLPPLTQTNDIPSMSG